MLDLTGPILPGVGAGGVEILDELRRHVETPRPTSADSGTAGAGRSSATAP